MATYSKPDIENQEPAPQEVEAELERLAVLHQNETPNVATKRIDRPWFRRRGVMLGLAGTALVLGIIFGARVMAHAFSHESTDDAFIESRVVQVSPKVTGHIAKLYVTDNQMVHKGDLLAEIDSRDYQVKLEQAKAQLDAATAKLQTAQIGVEVTTATANGSLQQAASGVDGAKSLVQTSQAQIATAQAKLEQAKAQIVTAQANLEQSRAQLAAAEAEAQRATTDAERYQKLFESGDSSRQRWDLAATTAQTANAQRDAARMKVAAAEAQVNEARASEASAQAGLQQAQAQVLGAQSLVGQAAGRLASAQAAPHQVAEQRSQTTTASADVAQAKAAVEQAELMMSYTKIYAPEDGRVTRRAIEEGTFVQIGQPLLAVVSNDFWVIANFKETQLNRMRPGQPVDIEVDAYPGKVFKGHVDSIQAGTGARFSLLPPENATGNFVKVVQRVPVKVVFDTPPDPQFPIGPGMSVIPEVKTR